MANCAKEIRDQIGATLLLIGVGGYEICTWIGYAIVDPRLRGS